ncbi:MAG: hypothetical protein HY319_19430, partial [Armatimonadetes bacterium]|nr:hypothetical protein [Armatimonadota bacterium]
DIHQRLDHHDREFAGINQRLDRHDQYFSDIHQRLDHHDREFAGINQRLDRHDQYFSDIHQRLDRHDQYFSDIVSLMNQHYDEMRRHFDVTVESFRADVRLLAEGISSNSRRIDGLDERVTVLERKAG